jgi:hypothetical protein
MEYRDGLDYQVVHNVVTKKRWTHMYSRCCDRSVYHRDIGLVLAKEMRKVFLEERTHELNRKKSRIPGEEMFSRWKVLPTQSYRNAQLAYKGN